MIFKVPCFHFKLNQIKWIATRADKTNLGAALFQSHSEMPSFLIKVVKNYFAFQNVFRTFIFWDIFFFIPASVSFNFIFAK